MKKFENIILASDIDGTFVWQYGYVHPKNYEKIKYFTENGGRFLFSSGRNTKDIAVAGDVVDLVNAPCVLCNGGLLYDIKNDVIENPVYLDGEAFVEVLRDISENFSDVGFRASYAGGFVVCETDEFIKKELEKYGLLQFATTVPLDNFTKFDMFKAVFLSTRERVAEVAEYIIPKYKDKFSFTRSTDRILELMPLGINKAYQFEFLRKKLEKNGQKFTLWCVGDYDNDIDMLRCADVAACPANATDAVKELCSVHLCHCKNGAVGELVDVIEQRLNI